MSARRRPRDGSSGPSSQQPAARFLEAAVTASDAAEALDAAFLRVWPRGQVERRDDASIRPVELDEVWLGGAMGAPLPAGLDEEWDGEGDDEGEAGAGGEAAGPHVWVVAAHKGMGKSKAIRASVRDLAELCEGAGQRRPTVLNVTFRRSLARGAAADFPGGTVYLDEEEAQLDAARHPVLTVLINSLGRVRPVAKGARAASYEVVILDEWVSILEMLGGDLLDGAARLEILRRLMEVLRLARAVVVSDALLDEASMRVLAVLLGGRGPRVRLIHYTHPIHADHSFLAYGSEREWEAALLSAVATGGRVVVPCMTKAAALRLGQRLSASAPSRNVLVYVAGGERDLQSDMEQIHRVWAEADVLVYSPVITAGCSFEVRGHFSECFLYAYQGTASPRSALQMVFRVRDLAARRIHVWVARAEDGWADADRAVAGLEGGEKAGALADAASLLDAHDELMRCHGLREAERRHCFALAFWRLVHQTGARIAPIRASALEPSAQLALVDALTARAADTIEQVRRSVPGERPWQMDDLEREGLLAWCGEGEGEAMPYVSGAPPFAQEHDSGVWHTLFLRRLVVQAGWAPEQAADAREPPRRIDEEVRAAVASVLVLGRVRPLVQEILGSGAAVRWLPGLDGPLQPLLVADGPQGTSTVLYLHTQSARLSWNDLESDVCVRAVFGWAVADIMRCPAPASRVRCIVASADASSVWARSFAPAESSGRPSEGILRAFDYERCLPRPLPLRLEAATTWEPARHVAHVLAGERRVGEQAAPAESSPRVHAIRPVDPAAGGSRGHPWTDPTAMLRALVHGAASHALWFETPDAEPVAIRCRPLVGLGKS
jgi:hypothetical protein